MAASDSHRAQFSFPTSHHWNIRIAGLLLNVRSPLEMVAEAIPDYYRDFLSEGLDGGGADMDCELSLEAPPRMEGERRLFGVEGSWTMFTGEDGERVLELPDALNPTQPAAPLWRACFSTDARRARIYCGPRLAQARENGLARVVNPIQYPLDQILLMYHLAERQGVLLHGAGVEIEGLAYLFLGKSGAGKSTLSRQLLHREDWRLLSDDRMIVRRLDGGDFGCGTPWPGDAFIARNARAPLGGVFFLEKGPLDLVRPIEPREAFQRLLPVASIPWYDAAVMGPVLQYAREVLSRTPAFVLEFRPTHEVADAIERHVKG